jgi:hypothetical protein
VVDRQPGQEQLKSVLAILRQWPLALIPVVTAIMPVSKLTLLLLLVLALDVGIAILLGRDFCDYALASRRNRVATPVYRIPGSQQG